MSTDITPSNKEKVMPVSPHPTPPHKKISWRKMLALAGTGTWWRGTWQDLQRHRDGITLDAAMPCTCLVGDAAWQTTILTFRVGYSTHTKGYAVRAEG